MPDTIGKVHGHNCDQDTLYTDQIRSCIVVTAYCGLQPTCRMHGQLNAIYSIVRYCVTTSIEPDPPAHPCGLIRLSAVCTLWHGTYIFPTYCNTMISRMYMHIALNTYSHDAIILKHTIPGPRSLLPRNMDSPQIPNFGYR